MEVDGEAHNRGDRPAKDAWRDAWLTKNGITTLRIPATEILRNLEGVLLHITEAVGRLTDPSPNGGGSAPKA